MGISEFVISHEAAIRLGFFPAFWEPWLCGNWQRRDGYLPSRNCFAGLTILALW